MHLREVCEEADEKKVSPMVHVCTAYGIPKLAEAEKCEENTEEPVTTNEPASESTEDSPPAEAEKKEE